LDPVKLDNYDPNTSVDSSIPVSPDGRFRVVHDRYLENSETGVQTLISDDFSQAAFSPDSRFVAGVLKNSTIGGLRRNRICIFDIETGDFSCIWTTPCAEYMGGAIKCGALELTGWLDSETLLLKDRPSMPSSYRLGSEDPDTHPTRTVVISRAGKRIGTTEYSSDYLIVDDFTIVHRRGYTILGSTDSERLTQGNFSVTALRPGVMKTLSPDGHFYIGWDDAASSEPSEANPLYLVEIRTGEETPLGTFPPAMSRVSECLWSPYKDAVVCLFEGSGYSQYLKAWLIPLSQDAGGVVFEDVRNSNDQWHLVEWIE
jgi:hypothetical protein